MKFLPAAILIAVSLVATACGSSAPDYSIDNVWARPATTGGESNSATSAVYMEIANNTRNPDRIVGVLTDVARSAELHVSRVESGIMFMEPQDDIVLPPNGILELKPGSYHVMLVGLNRNLNPGDTFTLIVRFRGAPDMTATVEVRAP